MAFNSKFSPNPASAERTRDRTDLQNHSVFEVPLQNPTQIRDTYEYFNSILDKFQRQQEEKGKGINTLRISIGPQNTEVKTILYIHRTPEGEIIVQAKLPPEKHIHRYPEQLIHITETITLSLTPSSGTISEKIITEGAQGNDNSFSTFHKNLSGTELTERALEILKRIPKIALDPRRIAEYNSQEARRKGRKRKYGKISVEITPLDSLPDEDSTPLKDQTTPTARPTLPARTPPTAIEGADSVINNLEKEIMQELRRFYKLLLSLHAPNDLHNPLTRVSFQVPQDQADRYIFTISIGRLPQDKPNDSGEIEMDMQTRREAPIVLTVRRTLQDNRVFTYNIHITPEGIEIREYRDNSIPDRGLQPGQRITFNPQARNLEGKIKTLFLRALKNIILPKAIQQVESQLRRKRSHIYNRIPVRKKLELLLFP